VFIICEFKVLTAEKMFMFVFLVVTPCGLVGRYQSFEGTFFDLQSWRWRQYIPLKRLYLPTSPHVVTPRRTISTNYCSFHETKSVLLMNNWKCMYLFSFFKKVSRCRWLNKVTGTSFITGVPFLWGRGRLNYSAYRFILMRQSNRSVKLAMVSRLRMCADLP
jgi:hypothetical protein